MTKRKDPQPEGDATPPLAPAVAEPFVVSDPVDPPPPPLAVPPAPQAEVIVRRGSILAPLAGGALAAIGGFALSHFDALGLRPADERVDLTPLSAQISELQAKSSAVDQLRADLATLSDRLGALETAPPLVPDLTRLDSLDQRLAAIESLPTDGAASTAALTAKLAELERRLAEAPQGVPAELQQQLDAVLARLEEAEATATARADEAAAATAAAERTRALDALATRLSEGQPFGSELQAVNDPALTSALSTVAETGAPSLAELQAAFPDAAREALRLAREASANDGWGARFLDFVASQTGARPLTPLEGDTPEAILSRADFALSEGRVADAVAELDPLDPAVKAALDPWLAQARAHQSAFAALAAARGE